MNRICKSSLTVYYIITIIALLYKKQIKKTFSPAEKVSGSIHKGTASMCEKVTEELNMALGLEIQFIISTFVQYMLIRRRSEHIV